MFTILSCSLARVFASAVMDNRLSPVSHFFLTRSRGTDAGIEFEIGEEDFCGGIFLRVVFEQILVD